ncbi:hypothetical protein ER308_02915 [Egibacter rhizosphaerae]|uniref:Ethanolamine utilization protein EutN n=1 Tax=Egibacter rhizosphaerae TaxID=1670831 RepID=A0A411YBQ1_9ACTN|nr:EutN/CcmL family microcompartment protein [Egibacter rhizosphaerae]QBI18616.1 hypothetical protein ER308_02915 [Egibacter rhizosphaerae]
MKIGKVSATVVATVEAPLFEDHRLLLCDLLDDDGNPTGGYVIASDFVGAGAGETVLILDEGNSARMIAGLDRGPLRAVIVGIVDEVDRDGDSWA